MPSKSPKALWKIRGTEAIADTWCPASGSLAAPGLHSVDKIAKFRATVLPSRNDSSLHMASNIPTDEPTLGNTANYTGILQTRQLTLMNMLLLLVLLTNRLTVPC